MCGFVGFASLDRDLSNDRSIIEKMNLKLQKRGPDEEGYFFDKNINLGHRRLIIIDAENGKQPMSAKYNDTIYTMVYNGQIYNKDEIKSELVELGYEFNRLFRYRSITKGVYSFWYRYIK